MTDPTDLIAQADAALLDDGITDDEPDTLTRELRDALAAALTRAELAERHEEELEASLAEMTRRRNEWRKKAEGFDEVRLALREKVGEPWPPSLSRILWAGLAADQKRRADDAEAERDAANARVQAAECHAEALEAERGRLRVENARLREAFTPIHDAARDRASNAIEWNDVDTVAVWVTIGDLRRARAAMTGEPQP